MKQIDTNSMEHAVLRSLLASAFFLGDSFAFGVCTGLGRETLIGLCISFWFPLCAFAFRSLI